MSIIYSSKRFSIEDREKNDHLYEYVKVNGVSESVMIVPFLPDGRVVMIHKYCVATNQEELVFPGGAIEHKESPEETAKRELAEETGYTARTITQGGTLEILPGYIVGKTYWVIAEDLDRVSAGLTDTQEVSAVSIYPKDAITEMIKQGKITDSRSIASFLSYITFYQGKE